MPNPEPAVPAPGGSGPKCATCGKPATCYGSYEDKPPEYACDNCCGHGCEDGHCDPIPAGGSADPVAAQMAEIQRKAMATVKPYDHSPERLLDSLYVYRAELAAALAQIEALREKMRDALSADGVTADDCPLLAASDGEADAWVEGYKDGQNSIADPLQAALGASRP
jgi:hypothetical protein